ncbi:MAG: nucleotidyl transferase AbiEii/AbiGii toxin family protein [Pseudomonadota bacterium]
MISDYALREVFHFLFLERLLRTLPSGTCVLKGGVNLRLFFRSPRYSEDMDLDVNDVPVHVLKEKGYRLLADKAFRRALEAYGIRGIRPSDPSKAKQTQTTQRFRLQLLNAAGEELPTKVEFSRRAHSSGDVRSETIDRDLACTYQRLAFVCPHYSGPSAALQKLSALAHRKVPQVRDLFDIHILHRGGHLTPPLPRKHLPHADAERARENVLSFSWEDFRDQILPFLDEESRHDYEEPERWALIQSEVLDLLETHDE